MVGNAGQHGSQIGFGVEAVEFGGFDQRQDAGGAFAALVRAGEQPVLAAETDPAQGVRCMLDSGSGPE